MIGLSSSSDFKRTSAFSHLSGWWGGSQFPFPVVGLQHLAETSHNWTGLRWTAAWTPPAHPAPEGAQPRHPRPQDFSRSSHDWHEMNCFTWWQWNKLEMNSKNYLLMRSIFFFARCRFYLGCALSRIQPTQKSALGFYIRVPRTRPRSCWSSDLKSFSNVTFFSSTWSPSNVFTHASGKVTPW